MRTTALVAAAAALLLTAGCSAKEEPVAAAGSSTTAAKAGAPGSTTGGTGGSGGSAGTTAAPGTTQPAGCTTKLEVVNAAAEEGALEDGALDIETAWSDQGPHPDNTVDYDKSLSVALAEFEIPKDKQFGYGIPIGDPKAPEGKVYLSFGLILTEGKIAAGQTFVDSTSKEEADGKINSHFMYAGSKRLLPGSATITITQVTDDTVCGTIETATKTDLQSFVGVEGTFEVTRIQALEAAEAD